MNIPTKKQKKMYNVTNLHPTKYHQTLRKRRLFSHFTNLMSYKLQMQCYERSNNNSSNLISEF